MERYSYECKIGDRVEMNYSVIGSCIGYVIGISLDEITLANLFLGSNEKLTPDDINITLRSLREREDYHEWKVPHGSVNFRGRQSSR